MRNRLGAPARRAGLIDAVRAAGAARPLLSSSPFSGSSRERIARLVDARWQQPHEARASSTASSFHAIHLRHSSNPSPALLSRSLNPTKFTSMRYHASSRLTISSRSLSTPTVQSHFADTSVLNDVTNPTGDSPPPPPPRPPPWEGRLAELWARLRARFKLLMMGPRTRPWKLDDFLALFTWFGVGTSVFVVVGTTTAVSILIAAANSIRVQGNETGFEISFESAIGSTFAPGETYLNRLKRGPAGVTILRDEDVDLNWTYWDTKVDSVDVTLSLWQWLEGRGLIRDCTLRGMRGVVDRRHVTWDPDWVPTRRAPTPNDFSMQKFVVEDLRLTVLNPGVKPFTVSVFYGELPQLRQQWLLYDLMCADSIVGTFDDCLFSVHRTQDPAIDESAAAGSDKRKAQWAKMSHLKISGVPIEHMNAGVRGPFGWIKSGLVDLDFHLFVPPTPDGRLLEQIKGEIEEMKEVAIDKLDYMLRDSDVIERLEEATLFPDSPVVFQESPLKLIHSLIRSKDRGGNGYNRSVEDLIRAEDILSTPSYQKARLNANFMQPASSDVEDRPSPPPQQRYPRGNLPPPVRVPPVPADGHPMVLFHCRVALNDLRASVPLSTPYISYLNSALIRPIVGYMNAHRTKIPISIEGKMPLSNYNGAWTFHSAGLIDLIGEEIGRAVTLLVLDERERTRHLKRVGVWSIQNMTKTVMSALDYARGVKGWEHWTLHFGSPWYAAQ
ncbi:mitochondrial distribution and morphology proteins-domain-containing protein [Zopfochytrium polystomum]|nr:mitochondrial distribution and morphology proteins-domain-containing protein [Zopfochytrium polystomum]